MVESLGLGLLNLFNAIGFKLQWSLEVPDARATQHQQDHDSDLPR